MADIKKFSRATINGIAKDCGVELPKEFVDEMMNLHADVRDAYAEAQVNKALENADTNAPKVEDTEEYKTLKKQFEDYKADVEAKAAGEAKESAYRALLSEAGVDPKRIDTIIRAEKSGFGEMDIKDGKFVKADELLSNIKSNWADFIPTTVKTGVPVATPPTHAGGNATMTKKEIDAIKDPAERQAAIAANIDLYRKG